MTAGRLAPALLALSVLAGCGGDRTAADRASLVPANLALADPAPEQELPEGVTPRMVAQGDSIYHGVGFCYTCHGATGEGVPQLGADLTDAEWVHTDGSYHGLVERIQAGVSAEKSSTGVPMPPRGGGQLTDDQVKAVAAYVWTLSRKGR